MALVDDVVALLELDDGKWWSDWRSVSRGWLWNSIRVFNEGDLMVGSSFLELELSERARLKAAYNALRDSWDAAKRNKSAVRVRRIAAKAGINPDGTTTYVLKPRFRWFRALGALGALAAAVVYAEQIKWVAMTALSLVR